MDIKIVTPLFENVYRRLTFRKVFLGLVGVLLLIPTITAHLILYRIEHQFKIHVYHRPVLFFIPGRIHLKPALLTWSNKIKVESGDLTVQVPLTAVWSLRYPISIDGKNLGVEFGDAMKSVIGKNRVVFDRLSAKIMVEPHGKWDILNLDAQSESLKFNMKGKD